MVQAGPHMTQSTLEVKKKMENNAAHVKEKYRLHCVNTERERKGNVHDYDFAL